MTNAAVADPASTSATQAAPGAGETQAPPSNGAGTDTGSAPASNSQAAVQTEKAPAVAATGGQQPAAGEVTQPPAPPAALTREEWQAQHDAEEAEKERDRVAKDRAEKLAAWQTDVKALHKTAPITGRDLMTNLEKSLRAQYGPDIEITEEMRKPYLDLIDTIQLKDLEGAKLTLAEDLDAADKALAAVGRAYYQTFESQEDRKAFSDAVKGKDNTAWPAVFAEHHQDIGRVNALGELVESAGKALGEAYRGVFGEKAQKAETVEALVKALVETAQDEGAKRPVREPPLTGGGTAISAGAAEPRNMREVRRLHAARQMPTPVMREYQQRNARGQFPD